MRTILFTGKGGVGKTSVALGTGALAADLGRRVLVLSTDPAHSLSDALGAEVDSGAPVQVDGSLWAQQVDAQGGLKHSWHQIKGYLSVLFDAAGVDRIVTGELTVLPGTEEVLALAELRRQVDSGDWDAVVVDCAPTGETLRLLALPEALGWYIDRMLPLESRLVQAVRPVLQHAAGVPMPSAPVMAAIAALHGELAKVRSILTDPGASVRLVLTPEEVVLSEARRSLTTLSLFGYRVDGVVVNRVFPSGGDDPWRARWVQAQQQVLGSVADSFDPLPQWRSGFRDHEPIGVVALREMARELYAGADPLGDDEAGTSARTALRIDRSPNGVTVLGLPLPLVHADDIELARRGHELSVTVAGHRRLLSLPPGLVGHRVTGARVRDGVLQVRLEET